MIKNDAKISDVVTALKALQAEHGDLPVMWEAVAMAETRWWPVGVSVKTRTDGGQTKKAVVIDAQ